MAAKIANGYDPSSNRSFRGSFITTDGTIESFASLYEERRMRVLDQSDLVKFWTKRHNIRIEYMICGFKRSYVPDFLVELTDGTIWIEEVKGWVRDQEEFDAKNAAAEQFCKENEWKYRVLFKADLEII